jgi:hypothetical protein
MIRRDALIRIGGFQQPSGMPTTDYPTWLELCRTGRFTCANEVLGFHREHHRQVTVQMRSEMNFVLDWGTRFVEALPAAERAAFGLSIDGAHQVERMRHAYLDYEAGRGALADRQDRLARAMFRRALRRGSAMTRLKASLGLGCSFLGIDLERMASVANRLRGRWRPGGSALDGEVMNWSDSRADAGRGGRPSRHEEIDDVGPT